MEARIKKMQQDLDTERRMRLEVEDVMKDIRREHKAPSIFPGSLKAGIPDPESLQHSILELSTINYLSPSLLPTFPLFAFSANERTKGIGRFDFGNCLSSSRFRLGFGF
jgi:hypothetical protein